MRPLQRFEWSDLQRRSDESRGGRQFAKVQWAGAIRDIERRRVQEPTDPDASRALESAGRVALASLQAEGMKTTETDVVEALLKNGVRGDLRSRQAQRIRNHVAIQLGIEICLRRKTPLKPSMILRWYTSLGAGLPLATLDAQRIGRIEEVCRRVNSPPMQLEAAVRDVANLYCNLISDPLAPSFNGVLARLIMRYHLGRCSLPSVLLSEELPGARDGDVEVASSALVKLLETALK